MKRPEGVLRSRFSRSETKATPNDSNSARGFTRKRSRRAKASSFQQSTTSNLRRLASAMRRLKPSSYRSYEGLLRVHVFPVFGSSHLGAIRREQVKEFLAGKASGKLARNSVRLILSAMRVIFNAGIEDGVIDRNPAARLGKLTKTQNPPHKPTPTTRADADQ